jgi:hypothetical protein
MLLASCISASFGGALDTAATRCNRCGADEFDAAGGLANAIGEDEGNSFLDACPAGGDARFAKSPGDKGVGGVVFVPGKDARFAAHAFAQTPFFERGGDVERVALLRENEGEKALAVAPADAGEVVE